MIGKIINVIKNAKDGIVNVLLLGQIKNEELVIWWRYGLKLISKQIITIIRRTKINIASSIDLIFKNISNLETKSKLNIFSTSDGYYNKKIKLNVNKNCEFATAKDFVINENIFTKLKMAINYNNTSEFKFIKIVNIIRDSKINLASSVIISSVNKLKTGFSSLVTWGRGIIAKSKNTVKLIKTAKAESAEVINNFVFKKIIQPIRVAYGEYATIKEVNVSRKFYLLCEANAISAFLLFIEITKNILVSTQVILEQCSGAIIGLNNAIQTSIFTQLNLLPTESIYADTVNKIVTAINAEHALSHNVGAETITGLSHTAVMSTGRPYHYADDGNLYIYRTKYANKDENNLEVR